MVKGRSNFFVPQDFGDYELEKLARLVAPDRILFGEVEIGDVVERKAVIRNEGRAPLLIEQWQITPPFELSFPDYIDDPPDSLDAGQSLHIQITYRATTTESEQGQLTLYSNDSESPIYSIELYANLQVPCLEVEPQESLDFGLLSLDATVMKSVNVQNCSPSSATTFAIESLEGDASFSLPEREIIGEVIRLEAGESASFDVVFAPREARDHEAVLSLSTNDPFAANRTITLHGKGVHDACPTAVIHAYHDDREEAFAQPQGAFHGVPLDVITLDASQSYDPTGGTIDRFEWTLVQRPEDTVVTLSEDADNPLNALYLELAGMYIVELHVWNDDDVQSCRPARMVVHSTANKNIHIQLVWDTPNDLDRFNNSGADLDLHLLHPLGTWNHRPYDCYWRNMRPDWGVIGDTSDDPSLDIDKVDGWGPENVNLDNPEDDTIYAVGVHYFADHGYGASYATLRIFIDGELTTELKRKRMLNHQFWHAADIKWPGGEVILRDELFSKMPN